MYSPSTSASFRVSTHPIKILEIPPYRRNQTNQNPTAIVNPSPPRISEIPSYKTKKSNDWQPIPMDNSNQEFQQLHLPAAVNSDLLRRLKNSDSTVHRSIDCIVAGTKKESNTNSGDSAALKIAPSWTNVAQRSESITSTTSVIGGASKKSSIDEETKGEWKNPIYFAYRYCLTILNTSILCLSFGSMEMEMFLFCSFLLLNFEI